MVGGSWRALARIDMFATGYLLPIIHQYELRPERLKQLQKIAASPRHEWLTDVSEARLAAAPVAANAPAAGTASPAARPRADIARRDKRRSFGLVARASRSVIVHLPVT